jgi:general stress protein 26
MTNLPASVTSARFPPEYGQKPGEAPDLLPWSYVEERLVPALNYWITTIGPGGRPHARPVDGVWVSGALCFGGSDETRWVRNLQRNPAISVHLPSDQEAIILEGDAELVTDPSHPLAAPSMAATRKKYPQYFTDDEESPFMPFWAMRPRRAYAWTLQGFPARATRWNFDR